MIKWVLILLLLLGGGYFAAAHFSGGAFPTFGLPIGGEEAWLRRTATQFWEDIQFKDFDKAAQYHAPDVRDTVDIPYLLERLFMIKPEALDLMEYEIVFADIDSTNLRSRVKTRLKIKDLVRNNIREQEVMLYFHRDTTSDPWYMVLESSLRAVEADKEKKH